MSVCASIIHTQTLKIHFLHLSPIWVLPQLWPLEWHLSQIKRINLFSLVRLRPNLVPCGQEARRLSPYLLLISPPEWCHLFAGWYKWDWLEQGAWLICAHMPRDNQEKIRPGGGGRTFIWGLSSSLMPGNIILYVYVCVGMHVCVRVCVCLCVCEWLQDTRVL